VSFVNDIHITRKTDVSLYNGLWNMKSLIVKYKLF
jgi:hypothetical protein